MQTDNRPNVGPVVETHLGLEAVRTLRSEWEVLARRSLDRHPFSDPGWMLAWWHSFAEPDAVPFAVSVRHDGNLIGLGVFRVWTRKKGMYSGRVLSFWENPHSNRCGILLDRDTAALGAEAIVKALLSDSCPSWDLGEFGSLPTEGCATRALLEELEKNGLKLGRDSAETSPLMTLPATWEDALAGLSSSYRKTVRRKLNQAARLGLSIRLDEHADALESAWIASGRSWQHASGTGIGSTEELRDFYSKVAREAETSGSFQLVTLWDGERPIGFDYNLVDADTTYNLKGEFDADYRRMSPGLVITAHGIRASIERGSRRFDFLGVAEPHKMHWTATTQPHLRIRAARKGTPRSATLLLRYGLRDQLQARAPWLLRAKRALASRLAG